jgi:hypothetical protein
MRQSFNNEGEWSWALITVLRSPAEFCVLWTLVGPMVVALDQTLGTDTSVPANDFRSRLARKPDALDPER